MAKQISEYFLAKVNEDEGDLLSNLKLQKLCYYAQGVGLAVRGEPMFRERIEAWLHGPATALYIYGSRARGDAKPDSDLDAYVEYSPASKFSLIELAGIKLLMEDALGLGVDITTRGSLPPPAPRSSRRGRFRPWP